jgi:hypothetical protein
MGSCIAPCPRPLRVPHRSVSHAYFISICARMVFRACRLCPLHTYTHAGGPSRCCRWVHYNMCNNRSTFATSKRKTFAAYIRNSWNTYNIRLKHEENTCIAIAKHMQHLDKTLAICVKKYATSAWNTCNIVWNICNTQIKHVQHPSETTETFGTDACNIRV